MYFTISFGALDIFLKYESFDKRFGLNKDFLERSFVNQRLSFVLQTNLSGFVNRIWFQVLLIPYSATYPKRSTILLEG